MTISSRHTPCGAPSANYRGPKRSLVLSGGGVRLSYQAGVIRALIEHGLVFHHLDGTSGGSLNLSMLLSGLSPEEMCQRWRTQNPKHFMGFLSIKDYLDPANLTAAGSADGVLDKVFPHLGIDAECIRRAAGLVGTYNVLNYNDKRSRRHRTYGYRDRPYRRWHVFARRNATGRQKWDHLSRHRIHAGRQSLGSRSARRRGDLARLGYGQYADLPRRRACVSTCKCSK